MKHGFGRDCQQISRLLIVPLLLIVLLLAQLAGHSHVATPGTNALQQAQTQRVGIDIKDTDYPIPQEAIFVAPTGDDTANTGSLSDPFRTIQRAIDFAAPGSTIVIRDGTYHESLSVIEKPLTLQPYPHEKVWLKGSLLVADFVRHGSIWKRDDFSFLFRAPDGKPVGTKLSSAFIDPAFPMAGWPDMVFIDGQPQAQVGSRAEVTAGTFFVDYQRGLLYIGTDPSGKTVEVAALSRALFIDRAPGTIIRGLGFMHYATARDQFGMVRGNGSFLTFEHNTFAWSAAQGLSIFGTDTIVRGNTSVNNGILGFNGARTHRLLFEQNTASYNNQEHFKEGWEAGGVKVVKVYDAIFRDNTFENNYGDGLWFDISCYNNTVVRNTVRNNTKHGIQYEISKKAVIASNLVVHNRMAGIDVGAGSSDVAVYNNTLANNGRNIQVIDDDRTCSSASIGVGGCSAEEVNLGITWDTGNTVLKNNILSNTDLTGTCSNAADGDHCLLIVRDYTRSSRKKAEDMLAGLNSDAYFRTNSINPEVAIKWGQGNDDFGAERIAYFSSLAQFQTYSESNGTDFEVTGQGDSDDQLPNPFFLDDAKGDYRLADASPARTAGEPLPQEVADAINSGLSIPVVTAGAEVDMGVLHLATDLELAKSPTATPADTGTPNRTTTPSATRTPTNTSTPMNTVTRTWTPTTTPSATPSSTATSMATRTLVNTSVPTWTPTNTPASTPTRTATNTVAPTATRTSTPTATPPQQNVVVYAAGQFRWTVVNGWGSAPTGGTYTLTGSFAHVDVTGSVGTIELPAASSGRDALLLSIAVQHVDLKARVQTNKVTTGYGQIVYFLARRGSTNNHYRARMRFDFQRRCVAAGNQAGCRRGNHVERRSSSRGNEQKCRPVDVDAGGGGGEQSNKGTNQGMG